MISISNRDTTAGEVELQQSRQSGSPSMSLSLSTKSEDSNSDDVLDSVTLLLPDPDQRPSMH